jgi:hypothetical protein
MDAYFIVLTTRKNTVWICYVNNKLANLTILILGQKEVKFHKKILIFCDLNSIYSGINLKLWNIKENNIFLDIF